MKIAYTASEETIGSMHHFKEFADRFDHILVHLDIDVLDAGLFHSTYFANKELAGDGSTSGKMTMEELSGILKCITVNTDVVRFTIVEFLPFDEYKLHKMLADIGLFYE